MSLLIAFSTINEAKPLLESTEHTQLDDTSFACHFGHILISGMGPMATLHSLYSFPHAFDELWNLGISGRLNLNLPEKKLFEVSEVGRLSPESSQTSSHGIYVFHKLFPKFSLKENSEDGVKLLTTDYPLFNEAVQKKIQNDWDLVDMEGYAFASYAKKHRIPLRMWKGVSDDAKEKGEHSIVSALPKVAERLADQVFSLL